MKVKFWGTRGSLPVAQHADAALARIARALVAAARRAVAVLTAGDGARPPYARGWTFEPLPGHDLMQVALAPPSHAS